MAETKEMITAGPSRNEQKRKLDEDKTEAVVKKQRADQQTGGSIPSSAAINIPTSKDTFRPQLRESISGSLDSFTGKDSRYSTKEINHQIGSVDSGYATSFGKSPGFNNEYFIPQSVGSSGIDIDSNLDTNLLFGKPEVTTKSNRTEKIPQCLSESDPKYQKQLETFFQRKFKYIIEEVSVGDIPHELYQEGIIDLQVNEEIKYEPRRKRKVEILIKAIAYSKYSNNYETLVKVRSVFQKAGYGYIVKDILEETREESSNNLMSTTNDRQDIICRLRNACNYLEDELDPSHVIDDLVVSGTLKILDHQNIREIGNRREKVKVLLENMLRNREKIPTNYASFCNALKKTCPWIEEKLTSPVFSIPIPQNTKSVKCVQKTFFQKECDCGDGRKPYTEIKFHLPGYKEIEQVIVLTRKSSCNTLSERTFAAGGLEVQEVELGSIIITLKSFSKSSHRRLLVACTDNNFLQDFLVSLLKDEKIETLSGLRKALCEVMIRKPGNVKCRGKVSKKAVVEHFSYLEKNMKNVDRFIKEFCLYNASDANEFAMVMKEKSEEKRNQQFLQKILLQPEYPSVLDYGLCLFEKLLTSTNQFEILKRLTEIKVTAPKITAEQIKMNFNFLSDELEPRRYIDVLRRVDGHDNVVDAILANTSRRQRCQLFLDFVVTCDQTIIDAFVDAIGQNGDEYIVHNIRTQVADVPSNEIEDIKEAIILNYEKIVDEIEPREMMFSLRESDLLSRNIKSIYKLKTRRERAVSLMKYVLHTEIDEKIEIPKRKTKESNAYVCFIQALHKSGYKDVAISIEKDKDKAGNCLRHSREEHSKPDCIHILAEFEIDSSPGSPEKESDLQIYLHRMLYKSASSKETELASVPEDKDTYIKNWVRNLSGIDGIDGSSCNLKEAPANKQLYVYTKDKFLEATEIQGSTVAALQTPFYDPSFGKKDQTKNQTDHSNKVSCLQSRTDHKLQIRETLTSMDSLGDYTDVVGSLINDQINGDLHTDFNYVDSDSIPGSIRSLLFEGRCNSIESVSPPKPFSPNDELNITDHGNEKDPEYTGHILNNDLMVAYDTNIYTSVVSSESFPLSTRPGSSTSFDSTHCSFCPSELDMKMKSLIKSPVEMPFLKVEIKDHEKINMDKYHNVNKLPNDVKDSVGSFTDIDFLSNDSYHSSGKSQFPDSVDGGYYSAESDKKTQSLDTPPLRIFPEDIEQDDAGLQNKIKHVYSFKN